MKTWITILSLLITLTTVAEADQTKFPQPEKCLNNSNEEMACFTLEQTKELLNIYTEREALKEENKYLRSKVELQLNKITTLEEISKTKDETILNLTDEVHRITVKWEEENLKRHEAENAPKWGSPTSWGITGAVSGIALFTLGALLL